MTDKFDVLIKKLGIWIVHFEKRNVDIFDLISNYRDKNINLKSHSIILFLIMIRAP
jgi:hypothetical protein